jgi:hypothetical protein
MFSLFALGGLFFVAHFVRKMIRKYKPLDQAVEHSEDVAIQKAASEIMIESKKALDAMDDETKRSD